MELTDTVTNEYLFDASLIYSEHIINASVVNVADKIDEKTSKEGKDFTRLSSEAFNPKLDKTT